jgi:endonuclease G, mitochondrial
MRAHEAAVRAFLGRVSPPSALESAGGADPALELARPPPDHLKDAAARAVDKTRNNVPLDGAEQFALEAIIIPDKRPAVRIQGGDFQIDHPLWLHFGKPPIKPAIKKILPSVGRIDLPEHPIYPYGGTGFVVGTDLLMTNRHVAEIFSSGVGDRQLVFNSSYGTGVDFKREEPEETAALLSVRRVVMIHPYWDMALLQVDGLGPQHVPLRLSLQDAATLGKPDVAVIGYPAFDPRNPADIQSQVFGSIYNVKRLQPGCLGNRETIDSFGHTVSALTHDSSTLGGNSGSVVFDPTSEQVVALHFAGTYLKANYGVPTAELGQDGRVIDAGVTFAGEARRRPVSWESYWTDLDEKRARESRAASPPAGDASGAKVRVDERSVATFTLPLEVSIRVAGGATQIAAGGPAATAQAADLTEKARPPTHDDSDLASRVGYDEQFLGVSAPPPQVTDQSVVALQAGGSSILHYHHFSLSMHKNRRLALFTASNLDMSKAARRPEPGRDYSRKGLTGLKDGDTEQWFTDPRISEQFQLPDRFFTKDNGAFDKGHIVRREDVAWGKSYQEVVFANGDTYHTTNCSPQVATFNRSTSGEDNWGDLENYVMKQAATERLSLYAGPVLSDKDPIFVGVDDLGSVRLKIPQRFWKVALAAKDGVLQSFAFLLEQDLSGVPLEFVVDAVWKKYMVSISDLEKELLVRFPKVVHDGDQVGTIAGEELRARFGAQVRRHARR